LRKAGVLK